MMDIAKCVLFKAFGFPYEDFHFIKLLSTVQTIITARFQI